MTENAKLSKAQLLALVEELQSTQGASVEASENPRTRELESALLAMSNKARAARRLAEQASDEAVYEAKLVRDETLSIYVRDRRGETVNLIFAQRGATQFLTISQISELKVAYPWIFDAGYLVVPEIIEASPNVIEDPDKFLNDLPYDQITARLQEITDAGVLRGLYHHIDALRYEITDTDVIRREIDPKFQIAQHVIADLVLKLSGVQLNADPNR